MTQIEFADAYKSGFSRTVAFILSKGINFTQAEEIAQFAWAKGWEHRTELRKPSALSAWINSIALNVLRNFSRQKKREVSLDSICLGVAPSMNVCARLDLRRALSVCSSIDRELIRLRHMEGCSSPEAGRRCGLSAVTARVRLMRARRKVQKALGVPDARHDARRGRKRCAGLVLGDPGAADPGRPAPAPACCSPASGGPPIEPAVETVRPR